MSGRDWRRFGRIHAKLYKRLGGRFVGSVGFGRKVMLLTTTGRKSGEPREVPLLYTLLEGTPVVVASNYGQEHHPAWSYNLDADPRARLEIAGTATDVVARRATDDEMVVVWPAFEAFWPGYEEYQRIAPRDIKMYVLEPAAPA